MQYKKFEKEEIEAIAEHKRLKKMKKYQLKWENRTFFEADTINEIIDRIIVTFSKSVDLSLWMDGKVLE